MWACCTLIINLWITQFRFIYIYISLFYLCQNIWFLQVALNKKKNKDMVFLASIISIIILNLDISRVDGPRSITLRASRNALCSKLSFEIEKFANVGIKFIVNYPFNVICNFTFKLLQCTYTSILRCKTFIRHVNYICTYHRTKLTLSKCRHYFYWLCGQTP